MKRSRSLGDQLQLRLVLLARLLPKGVTQCPVSALARGKRGKKRWGKQPIFFSRSSVFIICREMEKNIKQRFRQNIFSFSFILSAASLCFSCCCCSYFFPSETPGEGRNQHSAGVPERETCSTFSPFFASLRRIKFMFASIHLSSKGGLNPENVRGILAF